MINIGKNTPYKTNKRSPGTKSPSTVEAAKRRVKRTTGAKIAINVYIIINALTVTGEFICYEIDIF